MKVNETCSWMQFHPLLSPRKVLAVAAAAPDISEDIASTFAILSLASLSAKLDNDGVKKLLLGGRKEEAEDESQYLPRSCPLSSERVW